MHKSTELHPHHTTHFNTNPKDKGIKKVSVLYRTGCAYRLSSMSGFVAHSMSKGVSVMTAVSSVIQFLISSLIDIAQHPSAISIIFRTSWLLSIKVPPRLSYPSDRWRQKVARGGTLYGGRDHDNDHDPQRPLPDSDPDFSAPL